MAWTIPNSGDAAIADSKQAQIDAQDLAYLILGLNGTGVVSGCAVTPQGSPDMTVAVAAGVIQSDGVEAAVTAGNATIGTADSTNPRFDIVVATSAGSKAVRAGTAAATPTFPALTAGDVPLAAVFVPASDTTISSTQIVDKRVVIGPGAWANSSVPAAVGGSSTAEANFAVARTIPANTLKVGMLIRVEAWGVYTTPATAGTGRHKVKLGSTVILDTAAQTMTSSVTNRGWKLEGLIRVVSVGASGTVEAQGAVRLNTTALASSHIDMENTATVTVDTTVAQDLQISYQAGTSNAQSFTLRNMVVEFLNVRGG